ncbi:shikimate dehydrogenase [Laceyella sacchari]|jgi:shikimate dehydrogenase|uniref:Shikimate dehydrogenase (NADP(+)) n=1 Tax=Laceyella sacchari TaxID=37482 RepID=A0ABY5U2M6_LACSH|nr:shikimate dehydrogenase [Laceyella sacchari]UWE02885.1 shikimate dehydrogenase [Laceyella sacchari]
MGFIDSHTGLLGLLGDPVSHSKSPVMMNAALAELNAPYVYLAFRVSPSALEEAVRGLRALDVKGWNVTIPHKVAIMEHLDGLDDTAREIGAVNTVVKREGKWIGYNTDGAGYLRSLQEQISFEPAEQRVVLLGAGGAARAVGYALAAAGVSSITVANRTVAKAEELAHHLSRYTQTKAVAVNDSRKEIEAATLIINTTSVGMVPRTEEMPIPGEWLNAHHLVSDLVYHPRMTALLQAAKAKGAIIHTGEGMLLHQAALALELWLGKKAPVEVMRKVLEASLAGKREQKE